NFFVRIDFADIPESCHENSSVSRGDHLRNRFGGAGSVEHDVHRCFADFVRNRKAVPGRLHRPDLTGVLRLFHFLGGAAGVHQALPHAMLYQMNAMSWHPFAIKRRSGLQRMIDVVPYANVLAEEPGPDSIVQKRALIENCEPAEIEEAKSNRV